MRMGGDCSGTLQVTAEERRCPRPQRRERWGGPTPFPGGPTTGTPRCQSRSCPARLPRRGGCKGWSDRNEGLNLPNLPCAIRGNGKQQPIRVAKKLQRASNLAEQNKPATGA